MNVLIFSGTADGRRLSRHLADRGADVTVCVATEYGSEEQGEYAGIRVLAGRLDAEGMKALLPGFALCIDATHPYALRVSENLRAACACAGVPYRRLLRAACGAEDAVIVSDAAEAAEFLSRTEGRILLAIGSKDLSARRIWRPSGAWIPGGSVRACCLHRPPWPPARRQGSRTGTSSPCRGPFPAN